MIRTGEQQAAGVYRLLFGLYAKFGPKTKLTEAKAMLFVEANTTIPVPSVLDVIEDIDGTMIVMTRLPGEPLVDCLESLSKEETAQMVETLRDWFTQLHSLPGGTDSVCGFGGGECKSHRIHSSTMFGPFKSVKGFHDFLINNVSDQYREQMCITAQASHSKSHTVVFTHGDIHPCNMLVSENRITGLVDWECAGGIQSIGIVRRQCVDASVTQSGMSYGKESFLNTAFSSMLRWRSGQSTARFDKPFVRIYSLCLLLC